MHVMKPSEFKKMPIGKKAHHLTLLYFKGKCFRNGRPIPDYFKLRKTFLKARESDLVDMYLYLTGTSDRPELSFLWKNCHTWNEQKRQAHETSDYKPVSIDEL